MITNFESEVRTCLTFEDVKEVLIKIGSLLDVNQCDGGCICNHDTNEKLFEEINKLENEIKLLKKELKDYVKDINFKKGCEKMENEEKSMAEKILNKCMSKNTEEVKETEEVEEVEKKEESMADKILKKCMPKGINTNDKLKEMLK